MLIFRVSVLALCLGLTHGYSSFKDSIPNGNKVPHPCVEGQMWPGVGHLAAEGKGPRNKFGIDFNANGRNWSRVCNMDSDGDNFTNGQELGDPQCVWTPGAVPAQTTGVSHPGFCTPVGSTKCQNHTNKAPCEGTTFNCPAINEQGVQSRVLRFPETPLPNEETNYFCMTFDLDQTGDYHMIATKPEIDNQNVMHHMLLFGCQDGVPSITKPRSCGMTEPDCWDVIGLWTVGVSGECMYREAGFRLGQTGYKRVLLQFHWNNPEKRSDLTDSSGLRIYYTPNLRTYDAGVFITGQTYLEIPPKENRVVFESTCSSECTRRMFKQSIHFTQGFNHMHYRGIAQTVEKTSNGQKMYITNEPDFSYDSPTRYVYDPPMEIRPGDSLKTTCVFRSPDDDKTTFYGLGTSDEMCSGLFTYYPKEGTTRNSCISKRNFEYCKLVDGYYGDCHFSEFDNNTHPNTKTFMQKVLESCNAFGNCRKECPAAISEANNHQCLRGDYKDWALPYKAMSQDVTAVRFANAMVSCDDDIKPVCPTCDDDIKPVCDAAVTIAAVSPICSLAVAALLGIFII